MRKGPGSWVAAQVLAATIAGCGSSGVPASAIEDSGADAGAADGENADGGGADVEVEATPMEASVDLRGLHRACADDACPAGLTALSYAGIAGPSGPSFCSCEIPCTEDAGVCPSTTTCVYIADGPGQVCSN
jgi:hypothetical protein